MAGGNEVHDRVGEADKRRELHRAVKPDEVDMDGLRREVLARGVHVLGCDAQARALAHRAVVVEAFSDGDHHPAGGDSEVYRMIKGIVAMFEQNVADSDARHWDGVLSL